MVGSHLWFVKFALYSCDMFSDMISVSVEKYIDVAVEAALAHEMVICVMRDFDLLEFKVSNEMIEQEDPSFIIMIDVSITPNEYYWMIIQINYVLKTVSEVCKF